MSKYPFAEEGQVTPLYPIKELREDRIKLLKKMKETLINESESKELDQLHTIVIERHLIAIELEENVLEAIERLERQLELIER